MFVQGVEVSQLLRRELCAGGFQGHGGSIQEIGNGRID